MSRKRKATNAPAELVRRPTLPIDPKVGSVKLPFRRLDEIAVEWKGDVASLEKHLLLPKVKRRWEKDVEMAKSNAKYRRSAISQLRIGLDLLKKWEHEPDKFMFPRTLFLIERVLAQLELEATMVSPDLWPEFFSVIDEYRQLKDRTAPARFSAVRSVLQQSDG